ncbi:MAG: hypothetical protein JNL34_12220 [Anaerolineae bacterium]|nr:hypothetical protein [Anaerolineae bacterium]
MDMGEFFAQLPPIFPILLIASVLLIIAGLAILVFSGSGKKKDKKRKGGDIELPAVPAMKPAKSSTAASSPVAAGQWALPDIEQISASSAPPRPSGTYRLTLASGESVEAVEVMVLMRDVSDGTLIAQIGGNAYACPPAGADADFMRRYTIAVRDLSASAADGARPPRPASAAPPPAASQPAARSAAAPAAAVTGSDIPGDLPKFTTPETTEAPRLGRRPASTAPIPEINVAASIEAYLQFRLLSEERFVDRSIHVLPAGADGVRIEVDGESFGHIDDVTDPAVQAFLRETIADWQSRQ